MDNLLCSLTNHDTKCQLDKVIFHLHSYYFQNTPVVHRPVEELNYCSTSVDTKEVNDKAGAGIEVANDNADVGI